MPNPDFRAIPAHVVDAVPAPLAREENVMPLALRDGMLTVAVDRPMDFELIEKLRFIISGVQIETVAAPADVIRTAVARFYGHGGA